MERCGITHRTIPQRQAPQRWTCCTRTHPTALFVRAYNEQGGIVSQLSLKDISGWLHTKEKLLDRVLGDIRADSRQVTASQAPLKTSLPVYYVNCDVPVKSLASQEPAVTTPAAPVAPPV